MAKTRVVVVAGYASVRAGLHALIAAEDDLDMVGDVPTGDVSLARLLPSLRADVVVLDTTGDSAALDSLGTVLAAIAPGSGVAGGIGTTPTALIVVGDQPEAHLSRLGQAGLSGWGYLLRESEAPQIVGAVRATAAGLIAIDPSVEVTGVESGNPRAVRRNNSDEPIGESLTPREIEVIELMAEGLPNKIIATRLKISIHTAKFHVAQILGKLDATSRTEAVTIGARRGYVVL